MSTVKLSVIIFSVMLTACATKSEPIDSREYPPLEIREHSSLKDCEVIGYETVPIDRRFRLREFSMESISFPVCLDEGNE